MPHFKSACKRWRFPVRVTHTALLFPETCQMGRIWFKCFCRRQ